MVHFVATDPFELNLLDDFSILDHFQMVITFRRVRVKAQVVRRTDEHSCLEKIIELDLQTFAALGRFETEPW